MIVSVFGKNGSGKSTVAIHLSQYLSMQNKFVGLISLERRYGSIQRSLGVTVLESRSILNALSQEDIKEYFTKYNDSMYILSLADEDDITKYDAITKLTKDEKILLDFFKKINQLFDYVIIDLTEMIIDNFTYFAIKHSEKLINITESRPEALSFSESHKSVIQSLIDKNNIIEIINKHDESIINLPTIENIYGKVDMVINFDFNILKNERENIINKKLCQDMKSLEYLINNRKVENKKSIISKILRR